MNKAKSLLACLVIAVLTACAQKQKQYHSPDGYDLAHPVVYQMPGRLLEISGICFDKGDPSVIYAEQDEAGVLFLYHPESKKVDEIKFGKKGDYEDIAFFKGTIYVLRSDGVLFSFRLEAGNRVSGLNEWTGILPKGEYEGLFADEKSGLLFALCKDCSIDKNGSATGYKLKPGRDGKPVISGTFHMGLPEDHPGRQGKKFKLKPSALARHPVSGDWFVLSSVNKMLLVADSNFKTKKTYNLKPHLFLQPEGIAFDRDNNLYISNEGDKAKPGTILKFNYRSK
ncbi:SdiA-regulated domain-containing protein [Pararcticibacter amylolyticus]|uniref:SdiA-regulated family protein n=1 Tax=Pararcticibacter amylolyticus TaxID=2173175 RepID=A0A2U2PK44_9SPHI|nr:SdiA-regulated domain-containing protein [Pararcticibacter amylolyticus]PWG81773.1 SdiA-regulated family protein [Pararcticibacter amylolyticus]